MRFVAAKIDADVIIAVVLDPCADLRSAVETNASVSAVAPESPPVEAKSSWICSQMPDARSVAPYAPPAAVIKIIVPALEIAAFNFCSSTERVAGRAREKSVVKQARIAAIPNATFASPTK